jgi:outer membrane receptor protein involved in Fe transport
LPSRHGALAARWSAAILLAGLPWSARADSIAFLHTPPTSAQAGNSIEISGSIFGGGDMARARCRYRVRGESWKQVELTSDNGDLYRAIVPGQDVLPPALEYYCVAFDYFGAQSELVGSASAPRRIRVLGEAPPEALAEREEAGPARTDRSEGEEAASVEGEGRAAPARAHGPARPIRKPPAERKPAPAARDEELALFGAEDVVTLASRQAQSVSEAPAIATDIPEEQIRVLGLRTLPDALKIIPGFETSRDVQGFYRVAARGMRDDSALLILLDGHRLNSAYDAKAMLNLPLENAERVEAVRGPGSALHGSGAFLGVVDLVSKRREGIEGSASFGSFGSLDAHFNGGGRLGASDLSLFGDADFSRSSGYSAKVESDAASATLLSAGLKGATDPAGDTRDAGTFVNAGVELRSGKPGGSRTRLSARFLREDRAALIGLFDTLGNDSRLQWNVLLLDLRHEVPLGSGALSLRAFADQQSTDRLFQIEPAGYPFGAGAAPEGLFERKTYTAQTAGLEGALDLNLSQSHKFSVGLTAAVERLPSFEYQVSFDQGQLYSKDAMVTPSGYRARQSVSELASRLSMGAFVQDVWRITSKLSLTLGLRLDALRLPDEVTLDANRDVQSVTTHFVPSLDPRVGLVFSPGEGWSLKLLYGRAMRAPSIEELTERVPTNDFTTGQFEGNPNLRPAIIDTLELGVETATAVGENKVRMRANGFFNNFTDPIMAIDLTGNIIPLSNRSLGVRVLGAEAEVRFEVSSRAYSFINYSWFRATDLAAPEGFQYLTDVPQVRFNWATVVPLGRWVSFSVLAELGAERRNNARSKLEALRPFQIPAYALVSAQLRSALLLDHFEVALRGRNLFNQTLFDDVPRPDRIPGLLPREGFAADVALRARY